MSKGPAYIAIPAGDALDDYQLQNLPHQGNPSAHKNGVISLDSSDNAGTPASSQHSLFSEADDISKPQGYLTFIHGVALVVSLQIGAGIFSTPSQVAQNVPSPGMAVMIWIAAGLLYWTGAASLIELGIAIPKNGGMQEYLSQIWGDFAGFLCSWMTIVIFRPGSMAIVAMVFSEHLCQVILPSALQSTISLKIVAFLGVATITAVNCLGVRSGADTATVFFVMKVLAVLSIVIIGVLSTIMHTAGGVPVSSAGWFGTEPFTLDTSMSTLGHYATAAFGALYTYDGATAVSSPLMITTFLY